ncbi:serine--tRNA ligase [Fulvivirga sedimenti]|uniref:Serine--tRNA ligase n=1 Tax=Fulvivirga sedimenti TaxID=2879465 RepID=A0A9X1L1E7_9BACT|nr:serine--tRNA ligase [Fulvivirga sedimenti]MCA6078152.1 serine--tRNA ligase [Fulvivirga sedimenti]
MLQLSFISNNKETVVKGLEKRHFEKARNTIELILDLDQERKANQARLDEVLHDLNSISRQIGLLMKEGKKDEAENVKQETTRLKEVSRRLKEQQEVTNQKLETLLYQVPNIPYSEVPEGRSAENNEVVIQKGEFPQLPENAKPHWELIKDYDIIDFDLGIKITGAGFPVYKGQGARLQRALINFFLDEAQAAGYIEVQPPIVINEASGYGTGQLPDKDGQMYHIPEENFYLIPTAEVPITNLYRDVILEEKDLPVRHVGYTPCFRREAGSWGSHVRGLNRLHQFDKVEIVRIEHPDNSYKVLKEMCAYVEGLLEKLELPYRKLNLCAGDLGFTSAQTFDMEVYSAAQEKWLEVSSVSNFETFQANRLKLRFRPGQDEKPQLLHTLNGSALALPRIMAALIENNQTPEGIRIPKALRIYTGFDLIRQ